APSPAPPPDPGRELFPPSHHPGPPAGGEIAGVTGVTKPSPPRWTPGQPNGDPSATGRGVRLVHRGIRYRGPPGSQGRGGEVIVTRSVGILFRAISASGGFRLMGHPPPRPPIRDTELDAHGP